MLGASLGIGGQNGGLNPPYQIGGARSVQLALKLRFRERRTRQDCSNVNSDARALLARLQDGLADGEGVHPRRQRSRFRWRARPRSSPLLQDQLAFPCLAETRSRLRV